MNSETHIPGFCPACGGILPLLKQKGQVKCYTCSKEYGVNVFDDMRTEYTINFNSLDAFILNKNDEKRKNKDQGQSADEGPVVERKCPKCGNDKMSYATLQLRSADEGQTVFYTCTKCRFKETENS